jgi:hydrophobic/amphiphilic exporter-1 (mainly G- bacteria), HAE1 family
MNSPSTGEAVPLSTFVKWTREPTNFLSINHQSMFPSVTVGDRPLPGHGEAALFPW